MLFAWLTWVEDDPNSSEWSRSGLLSSPHGTLVHKLSLQHDKILKTGVPEDITRNPGHSQALLYLIFLSGSKKGPHGELKSIHPFFNTKV